MFGHQRPTNSALIAFLRVAITILAIAVPMFLSYTFSGTVVVAGSMVSNVPGNRKDNLASSALIMSMMITFVSVATAAVFAMNIYTNDRRGQLKRLEEEPAVTDDQEATLKDEISGVLKVGLIIGLLSLVLPMIAMFFSKWVLVNCFGQDSNIAEDAQKFLRIYSLGLPGILMRIAVEQILFSYEKQMMVMLLALASFAVSCGFAYWFCFGGGLVPAMGLTGAAYGFLIETYLTGILFGLCLHYDKAFKDYRFFKELFTPFRGKDWHSMKELAQSGLPISMTTMSQVIAPFIISMFAGRLGTEALAVQSFPSWLMFFFVIPQLGFGQAVAQETNRRRGYAKKQLEDMQVREEINNEVYIPTAQAARWGLVTAGVLMMTLCAIVMGYPQLITGIVNNPDKDDPSVISAAQIAVRITAVGLVLDTLLNTMVQTLRSLKDNTVPMGLSIGSLWVGVLIAYILGFNTDLGVKGLSTGYTLGNTLALIPSLWRFMSNTRLEALAAINDEPPQAGCSTPPSCLSWLSKQQSLTRELSLPAVSEEMKSGEGERLLIVNP